MCVTGRSVHQAVCECGARGAASWPGAWNGFAVPEFHGRPGRSTHSRRRERDNATRCDKPEGLGLVVQKIVLELAPLVARNLRVDQIVAFQVQANTSRAQAIVSQLLEGGGQEELQIPNRNRAGRHGGHGRSAGDGGRLRDARVAAAARQGRAPHRVGGGPELAAGITAGALPA
jgi:hypothetical protein